MAVVDSAWIVSSSKRTFFLALSELWNARAILFALVKRDLKSRYRTSIIGFTWAFAKPLMQLVVYVLVIGAILGASRSISNFPIFIFVGLMFWNFFSESVIVGTSSIISGSGLVTKISFPKEILPITSVVIAGINLVIQIPVLVIAYITLGVTPNFSQVGYLLPLLLSLIFIALGSALLLSSLNVYARDVQPLSELLVMLFMYICPVIYSWTFAKDAIMKNYSDSKLFFAYEINPLGQIITGIQDFFWNGERRFANGTVAPDYLGSSISILWVGSLGAMLFLAVCYKLFLKLEPNFAREL